MRNTFSVTVQRRGIETSGFTILELLVAAALSVVILTVAVGISSSVLRNWNEATSDLNRDAQLRYSEEALRSDLEQGVVTHSSNSVWFAAEAQSPSEWSMRWLAQSDEGVGLIEWATRPVDYAGDAPLFGFSLFRFEEEDWEIDFGSLGTLGANKPSDQVTDWWPAFTVGHVLDTEIEIGILEAGVRTTLFSSAQGGSIEFPFSVSIQYSKPDYVQVLLQVLSDDKVNEYLELSGGVLNAQDLQRWLDVNTVTVVWSFDILTDSF